MKKKISNESLLLMRTQFAYAHTCTKYNIIYCRTTFLVLPQLDSPHLLLKESNNAHLFSLLPIYRELILFNRS